MPARPSATPSPVPPSPADLAAAANRTIPDVLPPPGVPLRVLFCGINPSLYSAATGWHFARPGNRFWPALHLSGFTPRQLAPAEQDQLAGYGLGITNLVARATAQAAELDAAELRAGGERLAALIAARRPRGRQFHGHLRADRDTRMLHSGRVHGERPSAVAGLERHPHPAAVDRADPDIKPPGAVRACSGPRSGVPRWSVIRVAARNWP